MAAVTLLSTAARACALISRVPFVLAAQALYWAALVWRRALRTTFVAVTGTHGKTTTKELAAEILAAVGPTFRSRDNTNSGLPLTLNVLRVRPRHRFAVIEIGVGAPDEMHRLARLVRPDVAVVLNVLRAHTIAFPDRARHAEEKAALLDHLRPGGVAVLNADDPLVRPMAARVRGRVVLFGTSPDADVRAAGAAARWPERLAFDLHTRDGVAFPVRTRLVGDHWCTAATAALATAHALGVPMPGAVAALAGVEPFPSRLQPVLLPGGAVVLRDDYDGSFEAFRAALRVLAESRAARRVAVIGDASDFGDAMRRKRVAHLGELAALAADVVVFAGEAAAHGRRGAIAAGMGPEQARAFERFEDAAAFLRGTLGHGDLVLLKGRISDHISRLHFAQLGPIRCWRTACGRRIACDVCPELGLADEDRRRAAPCSGPAIIEPHPAPGAAASVSPASSEDRR